VLRNRVGVAITARVAESCGTLATVTDALTREELARTALACPPFVLAIRLAEWVGDSRELTSTSVLRPAIAVQACQALGIALPVGKLRSAKDVFELARAWDAAVAADLVLVTASRASAAPDVADLARAAGGTVALGQELTERAAIAWLRGAGTPLGFPGDPCGECLTVLHTLREAAAPVELADLAAAVAVGTAAGPAPGVFDDLGSYVCPECGQRHSAPLPGLPGIADAFDTRALDLAEHVGDTVRDLVDFGAVVQGPGRTPGGTVTLTPLGVLLAESILHTITPDPDQPVGGMVESVAWLPPQVALAAAGPWLAARTPDGAVSELLAFSEAFEGPMLRFIALEIARQQGAQALPAWRAAAKRPGFGAYARQWLASQGEPVEADDRDEAWLLADTITQSLGELPDGLEALVLAAAMQAVSGGATAELLAGIRDCGHPRAVAVARLLAGGPGLAGGAAPLVRMLPYGERGTGGYGSAVEDGTLLQLKVTLRDVSKPPVWRRVLVPATMTLGELHEVIARAMGWGGGHLHVFSDGTVEYGVPDGELGFEDEDAIELDEVLSEPGDRFTYTYDFGDDWEHDIKLEKVLPPDPGAVVPACLAGKGACPPEDCGGARGYADLKEAIIDPAHDEHAELLNWLGIDDPSDFTLAAFDLDRANARLRRAPLS
jgi:hypothetical protein